MESVSLQKSVWAKAYYDMQRERGKGHHATLRSLAFKWIRIMSHCWRERIEYDEDKYQKALRRANSPLLKYISLDKTTQKSTKYDRLTLYG